MSVRVATAADAADAGRLLVAFNTEFGEPTPPADVVGPRVVALADAEVLLAGDPPHGIAVLRFRPAIWADADECYLAELYVAPPQRGRGEGRALLEATIERARARGAAWIDLGTSEDDVAARALYESCGFTNREGGPDGPVMYVYEREL